MVCVSQVVPVKGGKYMVGLVVVVVSLSSLLQLKNVNRIRILQMFLVMVFCFWFGV